jgi:hypothetical protein
LKTKKQILKLFVLAYDKTMWRIFNIIFLGLNGAMSNISVGYKGHTGASNSQPIASRNNSLEDLNKFNKSKFIKQHIRLKTKKQILKLFVLAYDKTMCKYICIHTKCMNRFTN